ncbi:MAG: hypothetical protein WC462_00645 [archaeon]
MKRILFVLTALVMFSSICFACGGVETIEEGLIRTANSMDSLDYVSQDFCESRAPTIINGETISSTELENNSSNQINKEVKVVLGFNNFQTNELTITQNENSQIAVYQSFPFSYTRVNEILFCGKDKNALLYGMTENEPKFDEFNIEGIFSKSPIENYCDNNKICCAIAIQKDKTFLDFTGIILSRIALALLTGLLIWISIVFASILTKRSKESLLSLGVIIPIIVVIVIDLLFSPIAISALAFHLIFLGLIPLLVIVRGLKKAITPKEMLALVIGETFILILVSLIGF